KQAPPLVEQARMIKDVDELARLRRAVHVGSSLFDTLLRRIRPGVREIEVAGAIETRARKAGAEAMSFETIIASGKRSDASRSRVGPAHPRPCIRRLRLRCYTQWLLF